MARRLIAPRLVLAMVCSLALLAACDDDPDEPPQATLNIFAASSLTEAFTEVAEQFERTQQEAEVDVSFNFAGSPALRAQLEQGADADIYAAADEQNMRAAVDAALVTPPPIVFARNSLTIIVPAGNPGNVRLLPDLAQESLRIVLAAPEVPAGRYARQVFDAIAEDDGFVPGLREAALANVVSEEPNVKSVVAKVQLGEADAGIVYVTDVTDELSDDIESVEIPLDFNIEAQFPVALTANVAEPELARAFVDFLLSDAGQDILEDHGFQRAP